MNNRYAVIMAGGVGSRLWPVSRKNFPKQFHDLLGVGRTLLQMTYDRLAQVCPSENILVVTNEAYVGLVAEQLPMLRQGNILAEPMAKNTAPCIAYAAFRILAENPEASMLVAPSDHLITNEMAFVQAAELAFSSVQTSDRLITFGIRPSRPDTGYGYIECNQEAHTDVQQVASFREKPDLATAQRFLEAGNFLWNAGIFVWSARTITQVLQAHSAEVAACFVGLPYHTDQEQAAVAQAFTDTPSISIDYAVMEKALAVYVIPVDFGWTDLGTWKSVYELNEKDEQQNALQGQVIVEDTADSYIKIAPGRIAVVQGLENYIVIDENNVLLICQKDQEQRVKYFLQGVAEMDDSKV